MPEVGLVAQPISQITLTTATVAAARNNLLVRRRGSPDLTGFGLAGPPALTLGFDVLQSSMRALVIFVGLPLIRYRFTFLREAIG